MAPIFSKIIAFGAASSMIASSEAALRGAVEKEVKDEVVSIAKGWSDEKVVLPTECTTEKPCKFTMISDLDSGNRIENGKKMEFEGKLYTGTLGSTDDTYEVKFDDKVENISTKFNEAGRGGEFSELLLWGQQLISADDRTGILFQISRKAPHKLFPRWIFNEGDGSSSAKGFKIEWMAEDKDGSLIIGSHGNGREDDEGKVADNLKWVIKLSKDGKVTRESWVNIYDKIADTLGASKGYVTHEAIEYSPIQDAWYILPRRVGTAAFDPETDDFQGSNMMVRCSYDFSDCTATEIPELESGTLKGFSSFKFVPGTKDTVIAALRSAEDNKANTQASFLSVFTTEGKMVVPEVQVPNAQKLEGFAFTD